MSHYSNGYAIAIVQNGNVVESRQDSRVLVPFGSDYVVRLINRNSKRAVAKVSVDGQNVTGTGIVVNAHGFVDLERPTDKAVTFRFASTESQAAENHGKAGADVDGSKGLISVEWRPEKEYLPYETGYLGAYSQKRSARQDGIVDYNPDVKRSSLRDIDAHTMSFCERSVPTAGGIRLPEPNRSVSSGVTVEGQFSSQTFKTVSFDVDYTAQVTLTTLKLMGYNMETGVPANGTNYCPACRTTTMKKTDKFCRRCGEKL